tara:strand:+ start:2978 stop:3136 length:159 start_codon:yes stop_codon:yes gene_type:complete
MLKSSALKARFRLASDYDGNVNFLFGLFYQDAEQALIAHQYATGSGRPNHWK